MYVYVCACVCIVYVCCVCVRACVCTMWWRSVRPGIPSYEANKSTLCFLSFFLHKKVPNGMYLVQSHLDSRTLLSSSDRQFQGSRCVCV